MPGSHIARKTIFLLSLPLSKLRKLFTLLNMYGIDNYYKQNSIIPKSRLERKQALDRKDFQLAPLDSLSGGMDFTCFYIISECKDFM